MTEMECGCRQYQNAAMKLLPTLTSGNSIPRKLDTCVRFKKIHENRVATKKEHEHFHFHRTRGRVATTTPARSRGLIG